MHIFYMVSHRLRFDCHSFNDIILLCHLLKIQMTYALNLGGILVNVSIVVQNSDHS